MYLGLHTDIKFIYKNHDYIRGKEYKRKEL